MEGWKEVQLFVPSRLSGSEVRGYVHSTIRVIAGEAGDFVSGVRIGTGSYHAAGWGRWSAYYLPCPPGIFEVPSYASSHGQEVMYTRRPTASSTSRKSPCAR